MKLRHLALALVVSTIGGYSNAADSPADLNDLEIAHVAYIATSSMHVVKS